jgi:outer membrane protein OmpA-like peptidoglycan-associated protein
LTLGIAATAMLAGFTGEPSAFLDVPSAQAQNQGFEINRYQPTAAGEWSFWVDHPWYSSMRYFAAGITLNYAHNPLVFGQQNSDGTFTQTQSVIEHQLIGHIDLAGSFLDRVLITASLPVVLLETGTPVAGVSPSNSVTIGDPRLGLMVRLFGQPYKSAISMSIGANVWLPLAGFTGSPPPSYLQNSSDLGVRVLPRIVLGGLAHHVMWSFTGGFLYRAPAKIGMNTDDAGSTVGSELQFGAAIAYADMERRFAIGPEAVLSTIVLGTDAAKPFTRDFTALEVLLGFHYNIARQVNIGLAGGVGLLREPGTPDFRGLFRLAYAPMRAEEHDRDHDGIRDEQDACPDDPGVATDDPNTNGCPDRDRDGVVDKIDQCPDTPKGAHPDPQKLGCPLGDRDGDGVLDPEDLCPDEPKGPRPDPNRLGCPTGDRDKDGVLDPDDICPDEPKGPTPDPSRLGCPAGDRDKDGVVDPQDLCPDVHKGLHPDPNRLGCPLPDRDGDTIVDPEDACPDKFGAPHPDPKKNGCPSLVEVRNGQIVILTPVFFATNKDVILAKSFPVLQAVADALKASKDIKKVSVEGHTDDRGKHDYNVELSDRRAKSVAKWLIEKGGIEAERLVAKGYGPDKPIADNKKPEGRAKNRRVDFVITDPPQPAGVQVADPKKIEVPDSPDQSDGGHKKGAKKKKAK